MGVAGSRARRWRAGLAFGLAGLVAAWAPAGAAAQVVVYTSTDQEYAEVVLKEAEAAIGQKVSAVFDAEAAKTVGLERRLVAEKASPRADVFWNSEMLRTHRLDRQGVLATLTVPAALALPASVTTPSSIGFGLRARVIAVHTPSVPEADRPRRLVDLAHPRFKGRVAIARPLFGTTSTHFAALHAQMGPQRLAEFLAALRRNEVQILPGNGDVRDAVAAGRAVVGLTDTDDAIGAIRRGQPLAMIFPDQDGEGAFAVHMTVARVAGGPNAAGAQKLVEYLAAERTESRLIELGAVQIPVRAHLRMAPEVGAVRPRLWLLDAARIDAGLEPSIELIRKHLL